MRLIKPNYEILTPLDRVSILKAIEVAGRVCYKSEAKITEDSASAFVKMLVKRGHTSVIEHQAMSVRFIIDRGVSHELVRHRIASFSQESTRYCDYGGDKHISFIIPDWSNFKEGEGGLSDHGLDTYAGIEWLNAMSNAEIAYKRLMTSGLSPQQARSVLPNSLKTEIVVTANFREWKEIFRQRCAVAAHPQMREVMVPLQKEMCELLPEIFETELNRAY